MLKAFLRDSAVYGIARLLTGGLTLLALPIYTHALSPGEYGIVDLLTSLSAIAHVTVALEIAQGMGRHLMSPEDADSRDVFASTALWFTIGTYSLFVAAVVPFADLLSLVLFQTTAHAAALRVATLVAWSTGLFNLLQNLLRYNRRAPKYAIVSIVFSVTNVGVTLVLLLVLRAGLVALFVGQFIAGLTAVGLAWWFMKDAIHLRFDRPACRKMLAFSLPLVPSGIGVMVCVYIDRFAILRLLTVEDVGLYGVAFKISSVVSIVIAGFNGALSPLIYERHHLPETPRELARMMNWFLALATPILLFIGIFSPEIVRLAAPSTYGSASSLVLLLSSSILVATLYNFAPGLWIAKRTGWVALISVGSGLLNLGLVFVLIPWFGLTGAAVSTFLASTAAFIAHVALGRRFYVVPFGWSRLACTVACVGSGGLLVAYVPIPLALRAVLFVLLSGGSAAILLGARDLRMVASGATKILRRRRGLASEQT